jgi:hypothetical protein
MWADTLRLVDRIPLRIDGYLNIKGFGVCIMTKGDMLRTSFGNTFIHSNRTSGPRHRHGDWVVSVILEEKHLPHCFILRAVDDLVYESAGANFVVGDTIECYEAHKQAPAVMRKQFSHAGLFEIGTWKSSSENICKSQSIA